MFVVSEASATNATPNRSETCDKRRSYQNPPPGPPGPEGNGSAGRSSPGRSGVGPARYAAVRAESSPHQES